VSIFQNFLKLNNAYVCICLPGRRCWSWLSQHGNQPVRVTFQKKKEIGASHQMKKREKDRKRIYNHVGGCNPNRICSESRRQKYPRLCFFNEKKNSSTVGRFPWYPRSVSKFQHNTASTLRTPHESIGGSTYVPKPPPSAYYKTKTRARPDACAFLVLSSSLPALHLDDLEISLSISTTWNWKFRSPSRRLGIGNFAAAVATLAAGGFRSRGSSLPRSLPILFYLREEKPTQGFRYAVNFSSLVILFNFFSFLFIWMIGSILRYLKGFMFESIFRLAVDLSIQ